MGSATGLRPSLWSGDDDNLRNYDTIVDLESNEVIRTLENTKLPIPIIVKINCNLGIIMQE